MSLTGCLILFNLFLSIFLIKADEPLFYPGDFDFAAPRNKAAQDLLCTGCEAALDFFENKLPLKSFGKTPIMYGIKVRVLSVVLNAYDLKAACLATAITEVGILWVPLCMKLGEQIADWIVSGVSPVDACKSVGVCSC